jgi:hypothetical protein
MTTDLEIRGKLADYLAGELPLRDFDRWFTAATWDTADAESVAGEIELAIDEYTSAHWTEAELHRLLDPLATEYEVDLRTAHVRSASDAQVIRRRIPQLGGLRQRFSGAGTTLVQAPA